MARKMTAAQVNTLTLLNQGWPEAEVADRKLPFTLRDVVMSSHDCMDGALVRCHRTIKTDTPAGSQTQSFRIHPDGSLERKL